MIEPSVFFVVAEVWTPDLAYRRIYWNI